MVSRYLETEKCDNMFYPLCKMPLINHEEKKNDMSGHKCGYHWKLFNGKCYTISYRFERAEMRYEEAIAFCSSLHKESSLAKITSKDEIKWLCNTSHTFWVPIYSSYWVIQFYKILKFREIGIFLRWEELQFLADIFIGLMMQVKLMYLYFQVNLNLSYSFKYVNYI